MVQATFHYLNVSSIRKTVFENVIKKLTIVTTIASASTFIYLSSNELTQAFASESQNSNFGITESSNHLDSSLVRDSLVVDAFAADLGAPLTLNCSLESATTSSSVITSPDQLPAPPATLNPDNGNNQPLPVTTLPDAADCVQPDQSGESIGGPDSDETEFRHTEFRQIEDTINNHEFSSPDRSCSHANQVNQAILLCVPLQGS